MIGSLMQSRATADGGSKVELMSRTENDEGGFPGRSTFDVSSRFINARPPSRWNFETLSHGETKLWGSRQQSS